MRKLVAPSTVLRWVVALVAVACVVGSGSVAHGQDSAVAPGDYTIGIEDALHISVWGEPALNMTVRVRPDGKITFPLVNDVKVDGMSTEQLRQELTARLVKFVREPNVTVIVEQINSFRVYVLGEVVTQGMLNLQRPTRLLQAIAMSGGLTQFSKREVVIVREQAGVEQRMKVDYRRLISGEAPQSNPNLALKPGDTILVN